MGAAVADGAPAPRRIFGVPVVVALFFLGMMLPTSIGVSAGGLRLSVYRVVLILMFLPMLLRLLSGAAGRLTVFDLLAVSHAFWALLALIKWGGIAQGIESGGIYIVEFLGAYLVGRVYIRSYRDFSAFARAYVGAILITLPFTLAEAVTGIHILHDGLAAGLQRAPPRA